MLCVLFSFLTLSKKKARRYDSRTTIFSPEGRLYQVEYAMEAISHAGTCLGILGKDGILLAAERRNTNKLLDGAIFSEKIYKLNEYVAIISPIDIWNVKCEFFLNFSLNCFENCSDMVCSVAGITSDANVLTNELRLIGKLI